MTHHGPHDHRPDRRRGRLPREHRRALHDRRRRDAASASRSSSIRCRRARSPRRCTATTARTSTATSQRPDGRAARRRRRRGRPRRPRLQAARPVAHVLERRRRAVPHPRDHLPRRLRAASSPSSSASAASPRRSRGRSASSAAATRSTCSPTACPELLERFGLVFPASRHLAPLAAAEDGGDPAADDEARDHRARDHLGAVAVDLARASRRPRRPRRAATPATVPSSPRLASIEARICSGVRWAGAHRALVLRLRHDLADLVLHQRRLPAHRLLRRAQLGDRDVGHGRLRLLERARREQSGDRRHHDQQHRPP